MTRLAAKTATLAGNVQSTLKWSGSDFQLSLGYAVVPIRANIALYVGNKTTQVCYIGFSYNTLYDSIALAGGAVIAAVPANQTIAIDARNNAALAALSYDLTDFSVTLISAAAGAVTVQPDVRYGRDVSGGGSSTYIGSDVRSISDYLPIRYTVDGLQIQSSTVSTVYTVPAGKRASLDHLYIELAPTGSFPGNAAVGVAVVPSGGASIFIGRIRSDTQSYTQFALDNSVIMMESGDSLQLNYNNQGPSAITLDYSIILREMF